MRYDLSRYLPLLKLRSNLGFSTSRYVAATVNTYSATIGAQYPLHELWGVQADLGGRLTRSTFDELIVVPPATITPAGRSNEDLGWVATLLLNYRAERGAGRLSLTRNVQNAAGRSGSTELTAVNGEVSHRFTYELSGSVGAGYYLNRSAAQQFASRAIDETTVRVTPTVRYAFNPDLALDSSYEFALVHDRVAGTDARRNKVFVRLTARVPLFE